MSLFELVKKMVEYETLCRQDHYPHTGLYALNCEIETCGGPLVALWRNDPDKSILDILAKLPIDEVSAIARQMEGASNV